MRPVLPLSMFENGGVDAGFHQPDLGQRVGDAAKQAGHGVLVIVAVVELVFKHSVDLFVEDLCIVVRIGPILVFC